MSGRPSLALTCHPSTPSDAVRGVAVSVQRSPGGALTLAFRLGGDLARVRMPARGPSRRGDRLWEHTCFEAFISVDGGAEYHELNFAPSGEWAGYAFRAYRELVGPVDVSFAPQLIIDATADSMLLEAVMQVDRLSSRYRRAPLHVGLSAVIEASDGTQSYWALHHAAGRPDFHRAESWTLRLEPPDAEC
jgi:hypothetical protein